MGLLTTNRCPKCSYYPVHYSRMRGPIELFLKSIGLRYYRCARCSFRVLGKAGIPGARDAYRRKKNDGEAAD